MSAEQLRARRMLAELRGACVVIALLSFAAITWEGGRVYLLAAIGLVALAPIIAHADQADPGEDTAGEPPFIDPQGGRR